MNVSEELRKELGLDESFRDSIATVDKEGHRNRLYPKKTKGRYTDRRQQLSYLLLAIFFAVPFIRIGGQPFLMMDVLGRKFIILGQIFWPADFLIFVLAMIIGVIFIAVFTVAYGRIFCGWICPQTIFMEHVFRRIEFWIEGDRGQQLKLSRMPWNWEKIKKRGLKNLLFFGISFVISNWFLMYIIGNERWWDIVSDSPSNHLGGLSAMLVFTGVFYFVFAWFREQVCIMVCPYGRLQGALLDRNSIVIAYDYLRGEKRGKVRKNEDREAAGKGDCIDCNQCVEVCPTGIDIRNGTQLECVNCTACVDACDNIMDRVGRPRGLIRYDSENNIASGEKKIMTPRVWAYTGVLAVLVTLFSFVLFSRGQVEAIILRTPGQTYQKVDDNTYSNIYNYKLINKTPDDTEYRLELISPDGGRLEMAGSNEIPILGSGLAEGAFLIYLSKSDLSGTSTPVKFGIYEGEQLIEIVESGFNGPLVKPKK